MENIIKNKLYSFCFVALSYLKLIFSKKIMKSILIYLSKSRKNSLEITSSIGCTMMCDYCPQKLITSVSTTDKNSSKLDFDKFKLYVDNIPSNTKISWTGYTEPLLHEDFDKFVLYLKSKNFVQKISTTMHGKSNSQEFMSKFGDFEEINFHLPDNENLMKLKVTDKYLNYLRKAIIFQSSINKKKVKIQVIGENFEKNVEKLISELLNKNILLEQNINITKKISSRSNALDQEQLNTLNFKKYEKHRSNIKTNNFFLKEKKYYYCSVKRLNKSVLIPNGKLNICCMDYSLNGIVGDLNNQKLNEIYKFKNEKFREDFIYGNLKSCKNCEYYKYV